VKLADRVLIPTLRKNGLPYEEPHVLYIGWRWTLGGYDLPDSPWKNPFTVKEYGREKVVALYREYVLASEELLPDSTNSGEDLGVLVPLGSALPR
jgi:hypothetical protein